MGDSRGSRSGEQYWSSLPHCVIHTDLRESKRTRGDLGSMKRALGMQNERVSQCYLKVKAKTERGTLADVPHIDECIDICILFFTIGICIYQKKYT